MPEQGVRGQGSSGARPTFSLSDLLGATPAPVQVQLLGAKEFEVGTITGFAAGKTRGLIAAAINHAVKYPKAKVLIGRRTYLEMVNTVKQPFFMMADPLYTAKWFVKPSRWDYREGTHNARLANGSQFFFSNFDDPVKFRNEEYSMICVDQAEELSEDLWEILLARIRWPLVPPAAWQGIVAANDNGHNWMWRRFVRDSAVHALDPARCQKNPFCVFNEGHPDEDGVPRDLPCTTRRFFHGTTLDNSHNLSPRYLAGLLSREPEWQRHFIYATMEGGAGRLLPDPTVLEPFEPPAYWPRYRSIDHALNSPTCCLWLAVNPGPSEFQKVPVNGIYVYREYWQPHHTVDQHAESIKRLSAGENILLTVMDRSAFHLTQSKMGGIRVSIADLYSEEGIYCVPSIGDPFARVERINVTNKRGLCVSRGCTNLLRQMPEYSAEQSKSSGEYKITRKTDFHSVDALGYGLMMIPVDNRTQEDAFAEIKPDYLRKSGLDNLTRRHHEGEWKRNKAALDHADSMGASPVIGRIDIDEFWGEGAELDIVTEFDPFGGGR